MDQIMLMSGQKVSTCFRPVGCTQLELRSDKECNP